MRQGTEAQALNPTQHKSMYIQTSEDARIDRSVAEALHEGVVCEFTHQLLLLSSHSEMTNLSAQLAFVLNFLSKKANCLW